MIRFIVYAVPLLVLLLALFGFAVELLDAELLAAVYLELMGGRQPTLTLATSAAARSIQIERPHRPARHFAPDPAELAAHALSRAGQRTAARVRASDHTVGPAARAAVYSERAGHVRN